MISEYVRFDPPRRLAEYNGQVGHEVGGQMLSPMAYDALAQAKTDRTLPAYVVVGEYRYEDGRRYLEFGVTTEHIEANSDFRRHPDTKNLRLLCPNCETWDGKHKKACDR